MEAAASELLVRHGGAVGSGAAQWKDSAVDLLTASVAMWSGVGFDVSGTKKLKGGGCREWASLW